jgi:DNA-binding transcriptional MerR regulator
MQIGELSRRTGVNRHQLRYYEAQGLLEASRTASGYRQYGDDAVLRVAQIRNLLAAGLSTADIRYLLPCASGPLPELEDCPEVLDLLNERRSRIEENISDLSRVRANLEGYIGLATG